MAAQRSLYQEHSDAFAEHEIFDAVGMNDVKRVRELLDCGVDINVQDYDKGWTPLHVAASRGSKQAMELLVQRGCDLNAQVSTYATISTLPSPTSLLSPFLT
jgi:ankyrin repeat protein